MRIVALPRKQGHTSRLWLPMLSVTNHLHAWKSFLEPFSLQP
jgi:hypothetical protein